MGNNLKGMESYVPFDVERTRFLRPVLFCDFFLHIPRFWVFGSCLIRVGLLEYVRAEGW